MFPHQRMVRAPLVLNVGVTLVTILLGGCGSGNRGLERAVVSGTITYNGKPISEGRIRFQPDADSRVPSAAANIVDGRYRADLRGGVAVGTYKVEIEGYGKAPTSSDPMWTPQNCLPDRYNVNSQLVITIEPGSHEITKNFDLTE